MTQHTERANSDPDFQYIWDQKALAEKVRGAEVLPLNEAERIAQRTSQEIQYLAIENTRRQAKGMDALGSLDDLVDGGDDTSDMPQDSAEEPSAAVKILKLTKWTRSSLKRRAFSPTPLTLVVLLWREQTAASVLITGL